MRSTTNRGTLRSSVIQNAMMSVVNSSVILFFGMGFVVLMSVILFEVHSAVLLVPFAYAALRWKQLIFEFFLVQHVVEAELGSFQWYTKVDSGLFLGALPLQEQKHKEMLLHRLSIRNVLSIVEDFELNTPTLVGKAVDFKDLERLEVSHSIMRSPDFCPPSLLLLDDGANYLNKHLSAGRSVYCHCKSGIGRSASVVMAYFIKYKRLTPVEAWGEVKIARPCVFSDKSPQFKNLLEYDRRLKSGVPFK